MIQDLKIKNLILAISYEHFLKTSVNRKICKLANRAAKVNIPKPKIAYTIRFLK